MSDAGRMGALTAAAIPALLTLPTAGAVAQLAAADLVNVAAGMTLAQWALGAAEEDATQAEAALELARVLSTRVGEPASLAAQIAYGAGRVAALRGDLAAAEAELRTAQSWWTAAGDDLALARSHLGLTQILAMQGRYAEAEAAVQAAIAGLAAQVAEQPQVGMRLAGAYRNQGTLLVYQDRHGAALAAFAAAEAALTAFAAGLPPEEQGDLDEEFGHLALNQASAQTFLDAPDAAEAALRSALDRFTRAGAQANRGRAQTNLGRLYLRRGEYAAALAAFDAAFQDLVGELPADPTAALDALRPADELLLEQALGLVALNLLPEAELALGRAEQLFRATGQPYELAQARYTQGLLALARGEWPAATAALAEARGLYTQLNNAYWLNHTLLAEARLALAQGDVAAAPRLLAAADAAAWDVGGRVEAGLLAVQIGLAQGDVAAAAEAAQAVAALLGVDGTALPTLAQPTWPHYVLRLLHAQGQIAAARGEWASARRLLTAAVDLLDRRRATLPVEEVRTAFLDDKMAIYADLVVSLLATPAPSADEIAAAFDVVERARSRALLERLLASVAEPDAALPEEESSRRAALRRQLHWLYNRLLGEGGSRGAAAGLDAEVALHEAALQQLEWRRSPSLLEVAPVGMDALQAVLAADEQALVYFAAGDEVMAFVVSATDVRLTRQVASLEAVGAALAELRFELGRAELGATYVARHATRLRRGIEAALGNLHTLLLTPLRESLTAARVRVIPYGLLHGVPFHALWDGAQHWLEQVVVTTCPSASVAVHLAARPRRAQAARFAGFAPYDPRIPQAQEEIELAARHFAQAETLHGEAATVARLRAVAGAADVLHLATHGLFRPDNSFFSALKLTDGWVDVREIYRLPLAASLVVLSACESGVGQVRGGDEVIGLARGFLAAGARGVVASLWNVHDRSAAVLMADFYAALQQAAAGDPATALRTAQRAAIARGEHPYYWAAFSAIG